MSVIRFEITSARPPTRFGRVHYYFRRKGGIPRTPLAGKLPGSAEFTDAYQAAAIAETRRSKPRHLRIKVIPGSLEALIIGYMQSDIWKRRTGFISPDGSRKVREVDPSEQFRAKNKRHTSGARALTQRVCMSGPSSPSARPARSGNGG